MSDKFQFGVGYFEHGEDSRFTSSTYTYENTLHQTKMNAEVVRRNFPNAASVLDYGCGKGFLVRYMRQEQQRQAFGYDISDHAVKCADETVRRYLTYDDTAIWWMVATRGDDSQADSLTPDEWKAANEDTKIDVLCAFYTFEHMTRKQLTRLLIKLEPHIAKGLVFSVPLRTPEFPWMTDLEYSSDMTHELIESADWWVDCIKTAIPSFELSNYYVINSWEGMRRGTFTFSRRKMWQKDAREEYPIENPQLDVHWDSNE